MNDTQQQINTARYLFSGSFGGVLSTLSQELAGYPFGSLVPYCLDYAGLPILLLSHLSQHTRNLEAEPKVALTLTQGGIGDIQIQARLTCVAEAQPIDTDSTAIQTRYFRYFPTTQTYYEQLNFRFYRLQPVRFYFVGGFGSARWFGNDRLLLPNPLSAGEEQLLLDQLLRDYPDTLSRLPPAHDRDPTAQWLPVGIDSLGVDLRGGEHLVRVPLDKPIGNAVEAREVLTFMVNAL